jgi:uncharacterized DUF497 family protein
LGDDERSLNVVIIDDIIWLDRIVEKLAWKHNVLPSEVEEVLSGNCRIFRKEKGKVEGEHLYNALGKTEQGRYLSVFFIKKLDNKALVVTARNMNSSERRRYEKR